MGIGKEVRMNRLWSHERFCSVAVDHFTTYPAGLPEGLRDLPATLRSFMEDRPDAVTMHKGCAMRCWSPYAGRVPLIVQSTVARWDGSLNESAATPEDAVRLGADALAVAALLRGPGEGEFLRKLADCVREAERWDLPVVLHVYPLDLGQNGETGISLKPEHIEYAVRAGIEMGADVIKVPYTGDPDTYRQIVEASPVPVVAAGGPKAPTLEDALVLASGVVASGARGMTIGRNIWGIPEPGKALRAFKAVIHQNASPEEAMQCDRKTDNE